jgi:hypothetical protein
VTAEAPAADAAPAASLALSAPGPNVKEKSQP